MVSLRWYLVSLVVMKEGRKGSTMALTKTKTWQFIVEHQISAGYLQALVRADTPSPKNSTLSKRFTYSLGTY